MTSPKSSEDPFASVLPSTAKGLETQLFDHPLLDVVGERLDMRPGGPRCDHEDIGENEQPFNFEQHDVHALLAEDGVGCHPGMFSSAIYGDSSWSVRGPHHIASPDLRIDALRLDEVDAPGRQQEPVRPTPRRHFPDLGAADIEGRHVEHRGLEAPTDSIDSVPGRGTTRIEARSMTSSHRCQVAGLARHRPRRSARAPPPSGNVSRVSKV